MDVSVTVTLTAEEVKALQVNGRTAGELNIWLQEAIHRRLQTEIALAKKELTKNVSVIEIEGTF